MRLKPLFERWTFQFSCVQCLLTKYDNDINWLQCDTCLKFFHPYCLAETDSELESKTTISSILCSVCMGTKLLSLSICEHEKEKEAMDTLYTSLKSQVLEMTRAAESLESEMDMFTSQSEHLYRQQLKLLNIDLQIYHGVQW